MSLTWQVDGVDLNTSFDLLSGTTIHPPAIMRNATVEVPGRHGSIVSGIPTFEPSIVTLSIRIKRGTWTDMEAAMKLLRVMLARPQVTLTRASGSSSESATARLVSLTPEPRATILPQVFTAVFTVPEVSFKGSWATTTLSPWDGTQAISGLAGSSAPIVDPVFRLKGPFTTITLTDPVSGTGITWNGPESLGAATYLFIHPDTLTAWESAVSTAWTGTGGAHAEYLTYPAAGPLQLWPAVNGATTKVEVTVSGGGRDSGSDLTVYARKAYL